MPRDVSSTPEQGAASVDDTGSVGFPRLLLGAVGLGLVVWGLRLVLTGGIATDPRSVSTWLVAALLVHDAVLAPSVVVAGWLAARLLPPGVQAPVQVAVVVGGCVAVMSAPLWLGRLLHRLPTANATVDTLDYPRNLLLVLAVVVAVTALGSLAASTYRRRARKVRPSDVQRSSSS